MNTAIYGKDTKKTGVTPAVALCNPMLAHNVGAAVRAASCFGVKQVWFTGDRVSLNPANGERLPREERMKGYKEVELHQFDYFFEQFDRGTTPVAVELLENAELLPQFEHPENPLYVFGPEDGSIPPAIRRHCHRFVAIPIHHCANLAAAVYMTLYDRMLKRQLNGIDPVLPMTQVLKEVRGWTDPDDLVFQNKV